ncbi:MAG: hypothetical protein LBN39_01385 [Planctomycetaceae bacterium]|jgi:hypothetical protein|nr:hypothetical protein [Planctomycetaceae bacterium]
MGTDRRRVQQYSREKTFFGKEIALALNRRFWEYAVMCFRIFFAVAVLFFLSAGCSSYQPAFQREFSWQLNAPKSNNPIFVEAQDHEFLWAVIVDAVDSNFTIEKEMPIRLYDGVLTEGRLDTKPKIGASLAEPWHADSVGIKERYDCTLQTIRRRAEVHVIPETGGYLIEVKVYKELEDNKHPLKSVSGANLRFEDETDSYRDQIDVDASPKGWFILERDTVMEERLLLEILYRLKHPSGIIRKSKEPVRG